MDLCSAACNDTKLFEGPINLYTLDETQGAGRWIWVGITKPRNSVTPPFIEY